MATIRQIVLYWLGYLMGRSAAMAQQLPRWVRTPLTLAPCFAGIYALFLWQSELIVLLYLFNYIILGNIIVTYLGVPKRVPLFTMSVGRSMCPTIPGGYTACLATQADELTEGDIVTFEGRDGKQIHHRIIRDFGNDTYMMKGDNNSRTDGIYTADDILCKTRCFKGIPIYIPLSITAWVETLMIVLPNLLETIQTDCRSIKENSPAPHQSNFE